MKVLFISQCSKNALVETRRIIDQFAERKGSEVWETSITQQGLDTVKKLLKSTARRNTAVACHILKGHFQSELLWIVGNVRKFSRDGVVPTNTTGRDILRSEDENDWNTGEAIAILASLAALFHDFGKANSLFQDKLKGKGDKSYEPFRHEWISLILFKRFVGESSDKEWLERLSKASSKNDVELINDFPENFEELKANPLIGLPKLARFIGWLILSHHRLPVPERGETSQEPPLEDINNWMEGKQFSASWNSPQCSKEWGRIETKQVRSFPNGTPFRSRTWCKRASHAALRAIRYFDLLNRDWFQDRFSMHLSRAILMLSDHLYSARSATFGAQDESYEAYANTDRNTGFLKQKLDEHNIGVARNAFLIAKGIPKLRETLPAIFKHKGFKQRSKEAKFCWQDDAFDLASSLKERSYNNGFFGVNLASTGCGKTFANARIMYGLSDEAKGCRFSIALGLRILTLQTGDALKKRLDLENDDLAVLIGSQAFQELYELKNKNEALGSESLEDLLDQNDYVSYEGTLADGYLDQWFGSSPKLHKLVSAPILVSTIDHLVGATESMRGGKQIAPILRLLTSDLILDEPDDFDVADLPALCRLVNFAGVFGSRVLLSSATLPPAIVQSLFEAYAAGRKSFNNACRKAEASPEICCAWFDEFGVVSSDHLDPASYMTSHREFIQSRILKLDQKEVLRRAELIKVIPKSRDEDDVQEAVAKAIRQSIYQLHESHHQVHPDSGKRISIGLVRMANIDPMVAIAKELFAEEAKQGYCIHFCLYHSRFLMLVRSKIEEVLDRVLSRHNLNTIWQIPEIAEKIDTRNEGNHIFVVLATSVAEVGRDHDYDWAVVEPSSMRSIIQLAGRVQRHRQIPPTKANIVLLHSNINGLKGINVAFNRPGFESPKYTMLSKDLTKVLHDHQYKQVDAKPRLCAAECLDYKNNLVDLEHTRLQAALLGRGKTTYFAALWWQSNADWCGELQQQTRFRKSNGLEREFFALLEDEEDASLMNERKQDGEYGSVEKFLFKNEDFKPAKGNYFWINCDIDSEIKRISEEKGISLKEVSLKFAHITLWESSPWYKNPHLGFYNV